MKSRKRNYKYVEGSEENTMEENDPTFSVLPNIPNLPLIMDWSSMRKRDLFCLVDERKSELNKHRFLF